MSLGRSEGPQEGSFGGEDGDVFGEIVGDAVVEGGRGGEGAFWLVDIVVGVGEGADCFAGLLLGMDVVDVSLKLEESGTVASAAAKRTVFLCVLDGEA